MGQDIKNPFIIWTLQRTGGTNLAEKLFSQSTFLERLLKLDLAKSNYFGIVDQWSLHEPFNYGVNGRIFGQITEEWVLRKNIDFAVHKIDEILSSNIPIKHCVEMIPLEFSRILLERAQYAGYRHVFLYRRNSLERLLSLQYAKLSGVWGHRFKANKKSDDFIFAEPLPIQELLDHEKFCRHQLREIFLQSEKSCRFVVAYEDIYDWHDGYESKKLLELLDFLELVSSEVFKVAADLVRFGAQGTKNEYGRFSGVNLLKKKLDELPTFEIDCFS